MLKWIIVIAASIEAAWFILDGSYALSTGNYIAPKRGRHAGMIGPWGRVVATVGINPKSMYMKIFFVAYGVIWGLIIAGSIIWKNSWETAVVSFAFGALWYFPVGTLISLIQIVLFVFMTR